MNIPICKNQNELLLLHTIHNHSWPKKQGIYDDLDTIYECPSCCISYDNATKHKEPLVCYLH